MTAPSDLVHDDEENISVVQATRGTNILDTSQVVMNWTEIPPLCFRCAHQGDLDLPPPSSCLIWGGSQNNHADEEADGFEHMGTDHLEVRKSSSKFSENRRERTSTDSTDIRTFSSLSVDLERPELLRGVNVPALVRGFGMHFRMTDLASSSFSGERAEWLWKHSQVVNRLQEFVSHSWRDSAWAKFISLCLYYNSLPANLFSILIAIIVFLLSATGLLPTWWKFYSWGAANAEPAQVDVAHWCYFIGCATQAVGFFTWHHLPACLGGGRTRAIFFDKLCVHQDDLERKARGIRSFAAFLAHSECMLILWSPSYFTRLWCILEMAAFIHIQKGKPQEKHIMAFTPLLMSSISFGCTIFAYACITIHILVSFVVAHFHFSPLLITGCLIPPIFVCTPFLVHMLRHYARDMSQLKSQCRSFSAERAACSNEEDRSTIIETIANWFGSVSNFDRHVHTVVSNHFLASLPNKDNMYVGLLSAGLFPFFFNGLDYVAISIATMPAERIICNAMSTGLNVILWWILSNMLLRVAHLRVIFTRRSRVLDYLISFVIGELIALVFSIHYNIKMRALALGVFPLASFVAASVSCAIFLQCMRRPTQAGGRASQSQAGPRLDERPLPEV